MFKLKILLHGEEIQELELMSGREYTFGRGSSCDVQLAAQLNDQTGISRNHFRVIEENGQWVAQVTSKFGDLKYAGNPVQTVALEHGRVFKLAGYDFHFMEASDAMVEAEAPRENVALPVTISQENAVSQESRVPALQVANGPTYEDYSDFEGNDEATRVVSSQAEAPFLRIVEPNGVEEMLTLDGRRWIAGREDGCHILLNDKKASRRQFELSSTPQGYFIRDLGSSNGTLLNGFALAPDELKAIRSGDVIQVGKVVIHFEIRDPNFEKRLMVIPPEVRSDLPVIVQNPYEMINYPVPSSSGGAVRYEGPRAGGLMGYIDQWPATRNLSQEKKKKVRFYVILALVLIPLIGYLSIDQTPAPKVAVKKENEAFLKLSPKQQQQVKELFALAKNFYVQGKLANAADQLTKLHQLLPDGFENSIAMAQECQAQKEMELRLKEIEEDRKRQEQIRIVVERTIYSCTPIAQRTFSMDDLNRCLAPALEADPENAQIQTLRAMVDERVSRKRIEEENRRDYQERVGRGRALYERAQNLENSTSADGSRFLEAIEAYRKHIDSSFPDPAGLKKKSQQQLLSIRKAMTNRIEGSLKQAEANYGAGNYKAAVDNITQAKAIDPRDERAAELNARYRREMERKFREIYEEAVISEGLGQVDEAKTRWKKIIEMDHHTGEYYNKAKTKLGKYGSF